MATAYTALLGLALPVTGELSGTWGDTVNTAITALLDNAVAGTTTLSTDADVTLTTTSGAANTSRGAILLCSGARTVLRTITAPAQSKIYIVTNATTGGFGVKIVGVGPTTGVTIAAGESALLAWGGTDFIKISNTSGAATFTNLSVTGTTTLSGLTASTALALDASKNVVSVATTGSGSVVLSTSPTLITPALGTPSVLVGTNITGTATAFTASSVTTNANLTGAVTSTGNATLLGSFTSAQLAVALTDETGTGANVFSTSPTLITPVLGAATATSLQSILGNVTPAAATVTTLIASLDSSFTSTGSLLVSKGTTGQRPASPVSGMFRFNTSTVAFEGYNGTAFASIGGGATGGGSDQVFVENGQVVTTNYTITAGKNAMSTGPVTVNSGVTVTVPSGSRYVVI